MKTERINEYCIEEEIDILKKYNEKYALNSFQNIEDKVVINYLKKENKHVGHNNTEYTKATSRCKGTNIVKSIKSI
jgi:hypothetical protein